MPSKISCASRDVAPDSKIRSTAEYDAAAQLITLKQWDRAIGGARRLPPRLSEERAAGGRGPQAGCGLHRRQPARAGCRWSSSASRWIRKRRKQVQREALLTVSGSLHEGEQHAERRCRCWRSSSRRTRRRLSDAMEARQRLADIAGKSGDVVKRDQLVSRDREGGFDRGQRAHRSHEVSGRESAALSGAAGARCVSAACG